MSPPEFSTSRNRAAERSRSWQERRALLLREACNRVAAEIENGTPIMVAIRKTARRFRNRSLGNGLVLALSRKSLERHWYAFQKKGESALALRYVAPRTRALDPLMLRLIMLVACTEHKSVAKVVAEYGGDRKGLASLPTIHRAVPAKEIRCLLAEERSLIRDLRRYKAKVATINKRLQDLRSFVQETFLAKGDP